MKIIFALTLILVLIIVRAEGFVTELPPFCIPCIPSPFSIQVECPCGVYWNECSCSQKCKVCANERCYIFKMEVCEDGYVCHSDYNKTTVNWYNAGKCVKQ